MANLNPLISFEEPVTRQDLFDMWATASFSGVGVDDFAEGFIPIVIASSFSSAPQNPQPGQMFWHQTENLMFVFHDEVDNTGVSLWLAIGPDRFDTPALLVTPAAVGAGLELTGPDRRVRVAPAQNLTVTPPSVCGFNQSHINGPIVFDVDAGEASWTGSPPDNYIYFDPNIGDSGSTYYMGETAQSGEWIRMGIDGLMYMGCACGSHPSQGLIAWAVQGAVCMDRIFDGSISSIDNVRFPRNRSIGLNIFHNSGHAAAARTEPWWLVKCAFAPRQTGVNYFNTP